MRDLIAELGGASPIDSGRGRDLIAEMGDFANPDRLYESHPGGTARYDFEKRGWVKDPEGSRPVFGPVKPDLWEDQLKPTLLETGKQIFEIPKSLGEVGLTAGTGALGWLVGSGLGVAESLRPGSTRESVKATAEDAAGRLTYQPRTQPAAVLMEKAGRGIEALTGPAKEIAALPGESWNSPFLESVLRFAGELATFEAIGAVGKVKAPQTPLWYRKMTIKERGLVETVVNEIKTDVANGNLSNAQARELWKDPEYKQALRDRYHGTRGTPAEPPPPGRGGPPAPRDVLAEMETKPAPGRDLLAEIGMDEPRVRGQANTAQPPDVINIPPLPAAPILPGSPFRVEAGAIAAMERAGLNPTEFRPVQTPGGWIVERAGTFTPPVEPPPAEIVQPGATSLGSEATPVRENGGYTSILLKDGTAVVGGKIHGETYDMAVKAGFPEELVGNGSAGFTRPDGTTWNLQGKITKATKVVNLDEIYPGGQKAIFPSPLPEAGKAKKQKSPDGVIGRINQMGGLNVYDDYNAPEMRQFPDMARVMRKSGAKPDEMAQNLNDEGFNVGSGDDLMELLKSGGGRNVFTPDKNDVMMDRRIRREENAWIEGQLADLEAGGIDPRRIQKGQGSLQDGLVDEIKAEGVSFTDETAALKELEDFFADQNPNRGAVQETRSKWGQYSVGGKEFSVKESVFSPDPKEGPPGITPRRYAPDTPEQFPRPSDEIGPEPPSAQKPPEHRKILAAVKDRPWNWIADDLMDLKPSERAAKLDKIWGPEEDFQRWSDGEGPDLVRHRAAYDWAADLERAIIEGDKTDVASFLKDIQKRLNPQDYYAYEEIQNTGRNAIVPGDANKAGTGEVSRPSGAGTPEKSTRNNQTDLPGLSGRETFDLTNPTTEFAPLKTHDRGPRQGGFDFSSERGSTGPINESEILSALLKTQGKIADAMPHLEALGRSIYEGGKQRFLDWQAHMKTKLGDLWEAFKGHLRGVFDRLQSGEIGPLKNDRGSVNLGPAKDEVKSVLQEAKQTADEYLGAISTRLGNIDPSLKNTLRAFEFRKGMKATVAVKKVLPFIEKVSKMLKADRAAFDLARKNGDPVQLKALVTKYGLGKEYHELRNVLADLYKEASAVGYDVGYRQNYHPRVLKDARGFLEFFYKQNDWPILEKAIRAKEAELQRYLTDDEKAKLINYMLRGYPSGNISLSKPGQLKAREIETVTPELNKFYMDSDGALLRYISDVTDAIEARKLFGKGPKGGKIGNLNDTIGGYVLDLLNKGKIKPEQERIVRDILDARFNEVGTRGVFGLYKNLSYIDTMGSPISALTQIGDLSWALYKNGIGNTLTATGKAIAGRSALRKEDIGIERIASEFADTTKMARAVDKTFRAIGLTKMDNIGKESLINSTYAAAKQKAMTDRGTAALRKELEPIFEGETDQLIKDLRTGNITENVKLYLFNTLSDFQPISLSEMPQKYLSGGNGRIFYMLKSFTLKQFDIYRREAFQKIAKEGTRLQGVKNLIWLAATFSAANAGADVIKDLLLGRKIDLEDKAVDNMLRLLGISKFVTWKAREEGAGSAMVRQIAPPFKALDAISKDINSMGDGKGLEITQSIPVVGKLYYWWFGKGADKTERKNKTYSNAPATLVTPKTLKGLR